MSRCGPLPFSDTKPWGAADFYYAINATFRFIHRVRGPEGLVAWWRALGEDYMRPVWTRWREGGLDEVARYWRAFFAAEPGAEVVVSRQEQEVLIEVKTCPAIRHLRAGGREIVAEFCQHCYHVNAAAAAQAGYAVRVQGGNGSCRQRFFATGTTETAARNAPQSMEDIASC
ncbi:hypothetical protein OPIT5_23780 [Opitutaceae bacterium TAV5]|nr:hypothetical protein OPIT5_23780 [Opitutaceae bacterium TAV5]